MGFVVEESPPEPWVVDFWVVVDFVVVVLVVVGCVVLNFEF